MFQYLVLPSRVSSIYSRFHSWQSQIRASEVESDMPESHSIASGAAGDRHGIPPSSSPATMTRKDISFQINEARIAASNKGDAPEERAGEDTQKRPRRRRRKEADPLFLICRSAAIPPAERDERGAAKWQFKSWPSTRPPDGWRGELLEQCPIPSLS